MIKGDGKLVFRSKIGYTLSEVMISVLIGTVLLGSLLLIQLLGRNSFDLSVAFVDVNSKARTALDWMVKDARWATQLVSSKTINAQEYTTGDDELIIEIPAIENGDIKADYYDYIAYYLDSSDSGILKRTIDANEASDREDETRIIANNVKTLNFSSGATGLSSLADVTAVTKLEISLTTQGTAGLRTISQEFNTEVDLRNKE